MTLVITNPKTELYKFIQIDDKELKETKIAYKKAGYTVTESLRFIHSIKDNNIEIMLFRMNVKACFDRLCAKAPR